MPSSTFLVDAHVHFHACFDRREFLNGAARNFTEAGRRLGLKAAPGILCFTESAQDRRFREFREAASEEWPGGWAVHRTAETGSLTAGRDGRTELILVAGRQVVTAERLEVLALGCDVEIPDGKPLAVAIEAVGGLDGLAVLPWGFGKWTFGRGRRVAEAIAAGTEAGLLLGDNGGRPAFLPRPRLFAEAERSGISILSGTDPLPFADEARRVGSFGSVVQAEVDLEYPARSLLERMREPAFRPEPYGRLRRTLPFVRSQLALRLRKRRSRSSLP